MVGGLHCQPLHRSRLLAASDEHVLDHVGELARTLDALGARSTPDDTERHKIYAQAEAKLTGPEGALPIIPSHWATFPTMRKPGIEGWRPNLLDQYDFTKVSIAEE